MANTTARPSVEVHDFAQWRDAARGLLRQGVDPAQVDWRDQFAPSDLFAAGSAPPDTDAALPFAQPDDRPAKSRADAPAADTPAPRIPREMMQTLASAACHADYDRWAFLYRVLWRWQQGDRAVLSPADPDGARLAAMVKAVRHEEHDMHAYLRFRERPIEAGAPRFVAWFEPIHHILPQVTQHFAKRMGRISWMIATPRATVMWDGATVHT
ncbi:MAG: TIGR03915 family putative DNA repair protein, partial [Pseudomonadota bacterium]|nr:TIGR03915 family putative DNA repair protein [Pseudomonadota bacterium]